MGAVHILSGKPGSRCALADKLDGLAELIASGKQFGWGYIGHRLSQLDQGNIIVRCKKIHDLCCIPGFHCLIYQRLRQFLVAGVNDDLSNIPRLSIKHDLLDFALPTHGVGSGDHPLRGNQNAVPFTRQIDECREFGSRYAIPGVINVVTGLGEVVGTELTQSPDIQKIAFTGSTQIGKLVAKNSLDTMKRLTLELGGKSPNIILDDADLSTAIPMAINACYLNNGQACIAASRLIVPEDRLDEVKRLAKAAVEKIKMGDPRDKDVTIGPLASTKQYKRVQEYIKSGIEEGAELVIGGEGHPQGLEGGNFVKPTVFANVTREMRIAKEEIFGPVLSILTYKTEAEAIEIANDTEFGLIAYISSADPERATRVARKLAAGRVLINTLGHDPFAPFGGFKQSGIGREGGIFGLPEYLEPKAIIG